MVDTGTVVASVDLLVGIAIVVMGGIAMNRLRGGTLFWVAGLLFVTGIMYVGHAGIEVFGVGDAFYAESATIVTMLLAFTMIVIHITIDVQGVD